MNKYFLLKWFITLLIEGFESIYKFLIQKAYEIFLKKILCNIVFYVNDKSY